MTQKQLDQSLKVKAKQSCKRKLKLDMEQAAKRFGMYPDDLDIYVCSNCNFLHYGHKPGILMSPEARLDRIYSRAKSPWRRKSRFQQQVQETV